MDTRLEQLEASVGRLKTVLKELADLGCRHDLNPTKMLPMAGVTQEEMFENEAWWLHRVASMDSFVRELAKEALAAEAQHEISDSDGQPDRPLEV